MFTFPDPLRVADDTYLVRPLAQAPGDPFAMHLNSLVILGAEPVIVDTGVAVLREAWLEQVFGLVDPADVRWIFLSHDDGDHTGNLEVVLDMCPDATLVTSWFNSERMGGDLVVPPHRQRWVNDGESFDVGDRRLVAVRPPLFDSPTTRGLYDASTGVYWTSDAFGTPVVELVDHVGQMPAEMLAESSMMFSTMLSPWHNIVDPTRFDRWVDRVADLSPTTMVGAHGPVICGPQVEVAIERVRQVPHAAEAVLPGQPMLDDLLGALTAAA